MSHETEKSRLGKEPFVQVDLNLDYCAYEYGKSYTNLVTYSEQAGSWTTGGSLSVTADTDSAPDGALTADTLIDANASAASNIYYDTTFGLNRFYTASIYVKKDNTPRTTRFVEVRVQYRGSTNEGNAIRLDTSTGEFDISAVDSDAEAYVEDRGDYWRIWVAARNDDASNTTIRFQFYPARGASAGWSASVAAQGSAIAWGAQLVLGKFPGHYVKTTTTSATGSCDATDAKANLLTESTSFDNADWTKDDVTIVADNAIAPDGTKTADKMTPNTSSARHRAKQTESLISGQQYTVSCYFKTNGYDAHILAYNASGSATVSIDLSTGAVLATSGSDYDSNVVTDEGRDWYRVSLTFTASVTGSYQMMMYNYNGSALFAGDGTSGIYVWGAQLVLGGKAGIFYETNATSFTGTVGAECRNVRVGCQDTDNFTKIIKPRVFCSSHPNLPAGIELIPCIKSEPKFTPTEIKPDGGISLRSSISITVTDFPHHDRGVDPYFSTRSYIANEQGTYWGKLLANNPYYVGRLMRVKDGYIGAGGYSKGDLQTRLYVIDKITGPVYSGDNITYTIIGSDLLSLAKNTKIQIPTPNDGALNAAINPADTSLVLDSGTTLADYPTGGGLVAIGDEWITYTARSSTTLSGLTRAANGTTANDHDIGDGVQLVRNLTGTPVAVINEILTTDVGISSAYIPYNTSPLGLWNDEETNWHNGVAIDAYIGTPTGALTLLSEICEVFQIDLWWDEIDQEIKLKTNAPPLGGETVTELTDEANFIEGKISITENPDRRISRMVLHYDKLNLADDNRISNFARHHFERDEEVEGVNLYDEIRLKQITSRWLTSTNDSTAIQTAQRFIARFGGTPKVAKFTLAAKDASLKVGDLCNIVTNKLQDTDGSKKTTRFQITKYKEIKQGHEFSYDALVSSFTYNTRYAFVADNALDATSPMTVYDNASDAEKLANAFVGPNTGVFPDGGTLYVII